MIELRNVTKSFNGTVALNRISLQIAAEQTAVLIGPSGCGKSTLIRLLVGLLYPEKGEIRVQDQILSPTNIQQIRRQTGYVIQEGGLFPHLTARQNIGLMAKYLGWQKSAIENKISELQELTKLDPGLLERYPLQLSGGQRQRISLMRALMLEPDILLLDEPLGALDPMIRYDLQKDLKEIFTTLHKTVVLVTHDLNEAVYFGDSITLLQNGKIVQSSTFREMQENPATPFVTRFIQAQRQTLPGERADT
ncbi:MAG: ATP-binding cassette domain-containing protein [Calditrichia bacterium]